MDKKTKADERKNKRAEEVVNTLLDAITSEQSPWQRSWRAIGGFPRNAKTGRAYQGDNNILLSCLTPRNANSDPRWVTFKQARELGASVKKGEHGSPVFVPIMVNAKDDDGNIIYGTGADGKQRPEKDVVGFRRATVFHASQCNGLPEWYCETPNWDNLPLAEEAAEKFGVTIDHGTDTPHYNLTTDKVAVPHKSAFAKPVDYYGVLFHELCHATGHPDRLNREGMNLDEPRELESYAREELVAELGSWIVCNSLNIPHQPRDTAAYITGWASRLQTAPRQQQEEILTAVTNAHKAANQVLAPVKERVPDPVGDACRKLANQRLKDLDKEQPTVEAKPKRELESEGVAL